jgi:hypothetical protein
MYRRLLVLVAIAACGGSSDLLAPHSGSATPVPGPTARSVPMKGTYEAWGAFAAPPSGCAGLGTQHAGGGVETHTGRYSITTQDCVVGADFTGTFTKTAANGDQLLGGYAGTTEVLQPPPVLVLAVSGTLRFTGGTGRFTGAGGTQQMTGRQTIDFTGAAPAIHTVLELAGDLTIPRSN